MSTCFEIALPFDMLGVYLRVLFSVVRFMVSSTHMYCISSKTQLMNAS